MSKSLSRERVLLGGSLPYQPEWPVAQLRYGDSKDTLEMTTGRS